MDQHTFIQTLEAYQADLDTKAAVALVQELERDRQTAVRPLPTPNQVALALMTGHDDYRRTTDPLAGHSVGAKVCTDNQGNKVHAGTGFKKKVILEGTPRGNEIGIDIT